MKLFEYRLIDLEVIQDGNMIYKGKAEDLPEEFKMLDSKTVVLESGKAVISV